MAAELEIIFSSPDGESEASLERDPGPQAQVMQGAPAINQTPREDEAGRADATREATKAGNQYPTRDGSGLGQRDELDPESPRRDDYRGLTTAIRELIDGIASLFSPERREGPRETPAAEDESLPEPGDERTSTRTIPGLDGLAERIRGSRDSAGAKPGDEPQGALRQLADRLIAGAGQTRLGQRVTSTGSRIAAAGERGLAAIGVGAGSRAAGSAATAGTGAATGGISGAAALGIGAVVIPVAAVVAALGALVVVSDKLRTVFESLGSGLENYSADIAVELARRDVNRELALVERAQRIGPQVASVVGANSRLDAALDDLKTSLLEELVRLAPLVEAGIDLMTAGIRGVDAIKQAIDVLLVPLTGADRDRELAELAIASVELSKAVADIFRANNGNPLGMQMDPQMRAMIMQSAFQRNAGRVQPNNPAPNQP